jgi:nucleoside-diphosphate-sugar epimerase
LARTREIIATIRPQIIFHLASHVEGSRDLSLVNPTLRNNLVTTVNLLTAAAETHCGRFLLAGSLEEPDGEDGRFVPCSPYAASKWAAAAYARMFHKLYGVPVVLLRVFMVYGPGQEDERKLVPYVIRSFLSGDVPKLSSGQRLVDWIYVEDVAEGMLASAQARNVEGKTVDIGSGKLVSVRDVATTLSQLMESPAGPRFGAIEDRPFEQVRRADLAKTELLTGWAPRTSLENGLLRTIAWYKQQKATDQSCPQSEPFLMREESA